jgi:nucleoside-diphosphate-sugar epimerase
MCCRFHDGRQLISIAVIYTVRAHAVLDSLEHRDTGTQACGEKLSSSGICIVARIVIAGCGDVGSAAGLLLANDGHEVFGIRRRIGNAPSAITMLAADLCDEQALQSLPADVEVLIYAAAADSFDDAAYERAYVTGLRTVLGVLSGSSLRRVLFVSSTSVYAQDDGDWVNEHSLTQPSGFSGQRLLQAEAVAADSEASSSVVRFGGIYGPGRTRLLEQVRAGATCQDDPVQWTNRIHRDDCAGVLRHLTHMQAPQSLYIGVDSDPAAQCEVMQWLAQQMNAATPVLSSELQKSAVTGQPLRQRRGSNKRCSNQRLLDSGFSFKYPGYRQGYAALLNSA